MGYQAYSQGIGGDLQQPLARYPEVKARMIATCANGLKHALEVNESQSEAEKHTA